MLRMMGRRDAEKAAARRLPSSKISAARVGSRKAQWNLTGLIIFSLQQSLR